MRILALNTFIPPDPAPTARLLGELADDLKAHGWEVDLVSSATGYRQGKHRGWRRWLHELQSHLTLLRRGLLARRMDLVLCLSDPPALIVTASIVALIRRAKLVYWVMDVYPQIASALGEIRQESLLYRGVNGAIQWALQRCQALICLDSDMAKALGLHHDPRVQITPPWVVAGLALPSPDQSHTSGPTSTITWLYSGNLGRAHEYETLLKTQAILEQRGAPFRLVFQGGGPARPAAMALATSLQLHSCHWADYAADADLIDSLLQANLLIATQRPETRGLLWPSKLALLRLLPRPMLWIGPKEGAISLALSQASSELPIGIFAPGEAEQLADWLMEQQPRLKSRPPLHLSHLQDATHQLRLHSVTAIREHLHHLISPKEGSAL